MSQLQILSLLFFKQSKVQFYSFFFLHNFVTINYFILVYQKNKNPVTDFLWIQKLTGSIRNLNINSNDQVQKSSGEAVSIFVFLN